MSLRLRLTLASVAATAIVVVAAGIGLVALVRRDSQAALDHRLLAQAEVVGRPTTLATSLAQRRLVLLEGRTQGGVETRVIRDGEVVFATPGFPLLPTDIAQAGFSTRETTSGEWRVLSRGAGARPGQVAMQFASQTDPVQAAISSVRKRVAGVGLAAVTGSAVLAWMLTGVVLAPLRRLRQQAETVRETADLTTRVPADGAPTEVRELTESLNRMLERLEAETARTQAALEAARSFAGNAAHELRTPLTSMQTNVDVLQRNPDLENGERSAIVADLSDQQERLLALLEALRLLARGDLGLTDLTQIVDVTELAEGVVRQARQRFPDVRFELRSNEDGHVVRGWPEGLRVLLDNLVRNAATHGKPPQGEAIVSIDISGDGQMLTIRVDDNGAGIPAHERARVFERFSRGTTAVPGSGLGLALVDQQAALHRGSVVISESPAGGTRIEVALPAAAAP